MVAPADCGVVGVAVAFVAAGGTDGVVAAGLAVGATEAVTEGKGIAVAGIGVVAGGEAIAAGNDAGGTLLAVELSC